MPDKKQQPVRVRLLIATVIYLAFLLTLTHIPQDDMPSKLDKFHIDKVVHAGAYGVLTTLLILSMGVNRSWVYYVGALLGILIIGGIDEYTQPWVGRTCSVFDWLADGFGSIAAILIVRRKIKPKKGPCDIAVQSDG